MNKLYYEPGGTATADKYALEEARRLEQEDLYTSSCIVVMAARVLSARGEIGDFTLVWDDDREWLCRRGSLGDDPEDLYGELLYELNLLLSSPVSLVVKSK